MGSTDVQLFYGQIEAEQDLLQNFYICETRALSLSLLGTAF